MRIDATMASIWRVIGSIPAGRVASYGQVAGLAGHRRGARLAARALAAAPADGNLPWHRVLRHDGTIALPAGSASAREQVKRLKRENVVVASGRVDMNRFRWEPDLDELMWRPVLCPADRTPLGLKVDRTRGRPERRPERQR